jgi:uncharacterized surface protein with fasciclin (FAS1) repeats
LEKIMTKLSSLFLAGAFATLVPVATLAYDGQATLQAATGKPTNILDAARDNGGFSVFLAAVEHADMTAALSSPRMQYTLYAPTDAAFAKMPKEQLVALLEDKDELRRVIAQHVVVGRYQAADINAGIKRTLWGEPLAVTTHRNLHVNWVKVVATDLDSGNGVVHATDNVIVSSGEPASAFSQQLAQFNAASLGQGNRF